MADEVITKRRVTMTSFAVVVGADGNPVPAVDEKTGEQIPGTVLTAKREMVDYVRPDFLDAYVADAKTKWQTVLVSDEPDAGPGGYHGATFVPDYLDTPLAGQTFDETPESER